jgi:transposase
MIAEDLHFVIRLNVESGVHVVDEFGDRVSLSITPGEQRFFRGVKYKGKVQMNLAGQWQPGFKEPIWVISNLEPEKALEVYKVRMKVEESFRDLKDLLSIEKIMNKKRELMEKMVAMVLIAYGLGLLVGEELRDRMYGGGKKMGAVFGAVHSAEAAGTTG